MGLTSIEKIYLNNINDFLENNKKERLSDEKLQELREEIKSFKSDDFNIEDNNSEIIKHFFDVYKFVVKNNTESNIKICQQINTMNVFLTELKTRVFEVARDIYTKKNNNEEIEIKDYDQKIRKISNDMDIDIIKKISGLSKTYSATFKWQQYKNSNEHNNDLISEVNLEKRDKKTSIMGQIDTIFNYMGSLYLDANECCKMCRNIIYNSNKDKRRSF